MSNNDLYCKKCKSNHHPAVDCVSNLTIKEAVEIVERIIQRNDLGHVASEDTVEGRNNALQTLIDNIGKVKVDEGKIEKIIRDKFYSNMGVDASDMVLKQAKIKADMLSKDIAKAIVKELRG